MNKTATAYIAGILEDQARDSRKARITLRETGYVCQARFHSLADGTVRFDLMDEPHPSSFEISSPCVVMFIDGNHPHGFVSTIVEAPNGGEEQLIKLALPSYLFPVENRRASRVPVLQGGDFKVSMNRGSSFEEVSALDLSLCGVYLEFSPDQQVLELGEEVELRLRYRDEIIELCGLVTRHQGNRFGLVFPEVLNEAQIEPPETLRRIVEMLTRDWINDRLR